MRIGVFGAGAIGGMLAVRLAQGGATVSVVARGAQLTAIRAQGLAVRTADGTAVSHPVASDDPRDLGVQDVVIVTVKAPSLPSVATGIAPLLGPDTPVVFAMNGIPWWYFQSHGGAMDGTKLPRLDPGGALAEVVAPARIIGGVVYSFAAVDRPGLIAVGNSPSRLIMGEVDGRASPRAEAIAAVLHAGGFAAEVTERIREHVWTKLLASLASGPIAVLTGSAPGEALAISVLEQAARQAAQEGAAIAQALGCDPGDAEASIPALLRSAHRPSVLQDLDLGRPMEIHALYATPLELARKLGVATPTLDLLVGLVFQRARAAGLWNG